MIKSKTNEGHSVSGPLQYQAKGYCVRSTNNTCATYPANIVRVRVRVASRSSVLTNFKSSYSMRMSY